MKKLLVGGFAGAGKTRVAREVAELLTLTFKDLDEEISDGEGKSIEEIIRVDGIDCFRQLEVTYFEKISSQNNMVLSLGGGSLENQSIRSKINLFDKSIWLCQQPCLLSKRLEEDTNKRPLFRDTNGNSLRTSVSKLLLSRLASYSVLGTRIWAGTATVRQIAEASISNSKETVILGTLGKPIEISEESSERIDARSVLGSILQNEADQYLLQDAGKISKKLLTTVFESNETVIKALYGLYCIGNYEDWEKAYNYGLTKQNSEGTQIMEELLAAAFSSGELPYVLGTNLSILQGSSAKHIVFNSLACGLKAIRSEISDITPAYLTSQIMRLIELVGIGKEESYSTDQESVVTSSGSKAARFELCYTYLKAPAYPDVFGGVKA